MTIKTNIAMRLNPSDKAMLRELAQRLQRNQTDTVRMLVRETLAILREQDAKTNPPAREHTDTQFTKEWRKTV